MLFGELDILVCRQWLFLKKKVPTVGYDIDEKKVKIINSGKLPIKELKDWFGFSIKDLVKNFFQPLMIMEYLMISLLKFIL